MLQSKSGTPRGTWPLKMMFIENLKREIYSHFSHENVF